MHEKTQGNVNLQNSAQKKRPQTPAQNSPNVKILPKNVWVKVMWLLKIHGINYQILWPKLAKQNLKNWQKSISYVWRSTIFGRWKICWQIQSGCLVCLNECWAELPYVSCSNRPLLTWSKRCPLKQTYHFKRLNM